MKKTFKVLGTIILVFFVTFFSYGCKEKLKLSLEKNEVTIALGENLLVDVLSETSEKIVWETEDASIATVENGVIVGVSKGTTYITVTSGDLSAKIKVTVSEEDVYYTVTWLNYNGDLLELDVSVPQGTMPSYDGEIPTRGADFVFKGWDPKLEPVTKNVTYTARFEEINTHTVTWKNWDGSTLAVDNAVVSGAMANYSGPAPTKKSDERYDYMFMGWSPAPGQVTYNMTYTAQFTAIQKTYTVTWKTFEGTILKVEEGVFAGTYASWDGPVPTIGDDPQTGAKRLFDRWSPNPGSATIKEDTTFTAYFKDACLVKYISEGVVLQEEYVKENDEHVYKGAEPRKIDDPNDTKYFYPFKEWILNDRYSYMDNAYVYQATYDCFPKPGYYDVRPQDEFEFIIHEGSSQYEYDHGYAVISGWNLKETSEEVTIPAWYDGYPVMQIYPNAFQQSPKLKTVIFSDTVRDFHQDEFKGCLVLENIVFGKSMTYIGRSMFANCPRIVTLDIPEHIIEMGSYAFENCTGLQVVNLPDTFEEFESGEFSGCTRLTSMRIPAKVEHLSYTFHDCTALKYVTFAEDSNLKSLCAFYNCISLEYIELPASVRTIYNSCFNGCEKLEEIYLPDEGVEQIFDYAFHDCVALRDIRLPKTLKFIGREAFENCQSLFSLDIPYQVREIGENAFLNCLGLSLISVDGNNPVYDSRGGCNAIIETESKKLIYGCKNTTIPDGVEIIGRDSFYKVGITRINIPASVKTIETHAFYHCHDLPHHTYKASDFKNGDGNGPLEHEHFAYCVTSIYIPNTVETIQINAIVWDHAMTGPTIGRGQYCIRTNATTTEKTGEAWHNYSNVYGHTYWCSGYLIYIHWADGDRVIW
ncbi:MAG TPA: leucine-rich repeat protein [Bacilli bacterium]|jgi:hypothetical protein|nr:leucine-rich repeat protein [Bacilli bacterium]HOH58502.1 leucine-rich repeat protein [Bacilli bacterium]